MNAQDIIDTCDSGNIPELKQELRDAEVFARARGEY